MHQIRGGHANWPTICDCGTEGLVRDSKLVDGSSISWACWRADHDVR
jgi:hypothetical protein